MLIFLVGSEVKMRLMNRCLLDCWCIFPLWVLAHNKHSSFDVYSISGLLYPRMYCCKSRDAGSIGHFLRGALHFSSPSHGSPNLTQFSKVRKSPPMAKATAEKTIKVGKDRLWSKGVATLLICLGGVWLATSDCFIFCCPHISHFWRLNWTLYCNWSCISFL